MIREYLSWPAQLCLLESRQGSSHIVVACCSEVRLTLLVGFRCALPPEYRFYCPLSCCFHYFIATLPLELWILLQSISAVHRFVCIPLVQANLTQHVPVLPLWFCRGIINVWFDAIKLYTFMHVLSRILYAASSFQHRWAELGLRDQERIERDGKKGAQDFRFRLTSVGASSLEAHLRRRSLSCSGSDVSHWTTEGHCGTTEAIVAWDWPLLPVWCQGARVGTQ